MKFNLKSHKTYNSRIFSFLMVLFSSSILLSCNWGDQITSLVQPNPDDFAVLYSDTSTVQLSTVVYDSLQTGGADRLLVGRYIDPYFGVLQSSGFTQPELQSGFSIPEDAIYDSLDVFLEYDHYYYGDTTKLMNLSVHATQRDILLKNSYFNTFELPYDKKPLGTLSFYPKPNFDSLKVRLNDELGKKIFSMAQSKLITTNVDWANILQGITLRAGSKDNGAVIGIKLAGNKSGIRLHYHQIGIDGVIRKFSIVNLNYSYNQISGDRKGTLLDLGKTNKRIAIPSLQTSNLTFIQEGLGLFTRVDFPHMDQLKYVKYSAVNRAILKVYPAPNSVDKIYTAPRRIFIYYVDKFNEFGNSPVPLTSLNGGTPIEGNYVENIIDNEQYYIFDVSGYVSGIMFSDTKVESGLGLITSSLTAAEFPESRMGFAKGLNRLVIGDSKVGKKATKLELYYTTVKYNEKK